MLKYIPVALATGLCPDTLGAFYNQQYRRCMGSMSLLASENFRQAKMLFSARLCYVSGFFYYLHKALFTFAAPLIPVVLLAAIPERTRVANLIYILPSVLYTAVIFPMWHRDLSVPSKPIDSATALRRPGAKWRADCPDTRRCANALAAERSRIAG